MAGASFSRWVLAITFRAPRVSNANRHTTGSVFFSEADARNGSRLALDDRWASVEDGFTRETLQADDELIATYAFQPSVREAVRPADGFLPVADLEEQAGECNGVPGRIHAKQGPQR